MRLNLWLIRHGQSSINAGQWIANPAHAHLTDLGNMQAQQAAAQIYEPPHLIIRSPLLRAEETAQYVINKWPESPVMIWPIEEIMYLSPQKLQPLNAQERKEHIDAYWSKSDPTYCDGQDSESFAVFLKRVHWFYQHIIKQEGFITVIGHGQFFKAFQLGLSHGFRANALWMTLFREQEIKNPMDNGEIYKMFL